GSQPGFNYGLAHLSAVLKSAGHEVALLQLCEEISPLPSRTAFMTTVNSEKPDIVGFSVVTNQWAYTRKLAAWTRETTSAPLICGGIHAMAAPEEILESGLFDFVVRGEAEDALLELVDKLDRGEDISTVTNLGFLRDGKIQINPVRALPDIGRLPFKDYDIFDFQKIIDAKKGWVGLMASRGCPFACTYCFNHHMVETYRNDLNCSFQTLNYIRHIAVDAIIAEINYLCDHYHGIKMFIFDDDLFTYYKDYVKAFCAAYKNTSQLPFVVNAHVGFFDTDRADALAAANCRIVKLGVESGSPRIRKQILNRHMSNTVIIDAVQTAKDAGLHTSVFLMIGLPGETEDDIMATIKLMAASLPGRFRWSFFFPYPGTTAYEISRRENLIDHAKMARMDNFTDDTCLDFGERQNLFLKKIGRALPWFVNAYSKLPVADAYREKVEDILRMDAAAWARIEDKIMAEDRALSEHFVNQGLSHYAIKYNRFMGVISDYFLTEE
ncbi:MAG: radical SAM protein, partial [Desulfobacterales bacterium]|nr:radical SAM protein [Desulfobacterales bacterium]